MTNVCPLEEKVQYCGDILVLCPESERLDYS
jgi:hypothetical protein